MYSIVHNNMYTVQHILACVYRSVYTHGPFFPATTCWCKFFSPPFWILKYGYLLIEYPNKIYYIYIWGFASLTASSISTIFQCIFKIFQIIVNFSKLLFFLFLNILQIQSSKYQNVWISVKFCIQLGEFLQGEK